MNFITKNLEFYEKFQEFYLVSEDNKKKLCVSNDIGNNHIQLVQNDHPDELNQKFKIQNLDDGTIKIISMYNKNVLDVEGDFKNNGTTNNSLWLS